MSSAHAFTVKQKLEGSVLHLTLAGSIDEDSDFPAVPNDGYSKAVLDLQGVKSINSIGIREWLKWIQPLTQKAALEFVNCPKAIVLQFNMVDGFLPKGAVVSSFYVPYFCENCDREDSFLFHVGKEVVVNAGVIQVNFDHQKEAKCETQPCSSEIDVTPAKYFQFLKKTA